MRHFFILILSLFSLNALAGEITSDMDALGANKELMKKAKAIDPQNRVRVVQKREVDRYFRMELGMNYGMAAGGDPYVDTNILGGQLDFHFTPRFSMGARYLNASNSLNAEGKKIFADAEARKNAGDNNFRRPGVDYAKNEWLGVFNWYPIYGKVNLFDLTVAQFDIYLLGGAGQINLSSGTAPLYSAGAGMGVWWNQHLTTRLEARWQGYRDSIFDGEKTTQRDINQTLLTVNIGLLL